MPDVALQPLFALSARATISMTALLTLAGMFGNLSSFTPQISYTTKMDNWMVVSMIFVFSTLLELVVALVYKVYITDHLNKKDSSKVWAINSSHQSHQNLPTKELNAEEIDKKLLFAEKCLTVFYFSVFVIYCLAYWLTTLNI